MTQLLDLPAELRLHIWDYCVVYDEIEDRSLICEPLISQIQLSLFLVSKQVKAEVAWCMELRHTWVSISLPGETPENHEQLLNLQTQLYHRIDVAYRPRILNTDDTRIFKGILIDYSEQRSSPVTIQTRAKRGFTFACTARSFANFLRGSFKGTEMLPGPHIYILGDVKMIQSLVFLRFLPEAKIAEVGSISHDLPIGKLTAQIRRNRDATDYMHEILSEAYKTFNQGKYSLTALICHFGVRVSVLVKERRDRNVREINTPRWFEFDRLVVETRILVIKSLLEILWPSGSNDTPHYDDLVLEVEGQIQQSWTDDEVSTTQEQWAELHYLRGKTHHYSASLSPVSPVSGDIDVYLTIQDYEGDLAGYQQKQYLYAAEEYYLATRIGNEDRYTRSLEEVRNKSGLFKQQEVKYCEHVFSSGEVWRGHCMTLQRIQRDYPDEQMNLIQMRPDEAQTEAWNNRRLF